MTRSLLAALALSTASLPADVWTDSFSFESVAVPPGIDPQIGGIAAFPDGRLAVCFHRGEVLIYDPSNSSWSPFAAGLHEPLGILVDRDGSLLVMQRPELTRLDDTDGDGQADTYETVYDGFGLTGNYHEFAFGPARDAKGNLYIALNLASNGAGIAPEIRGTWDETGLPRDEMLAGKNWGKSRGAAGRMYSRVPYRGWVIRLDPDGSNPKPFASGFRSPDGIGFDAAGRLLVTDNQGDWRGTSPVHDVREGGFYGHPASLVWRPGWTRNPLQVPVSELEDLSTPAMGLFPQGELANSPTQPIAIPAGTFGPFAGQTLIGEMNQPTLIRFLPDPQEGVSQGASIPFLRGKTLGAGNHRLAFTPDGSLWIGKTHLSWAGSEGLTRIRLKDNNIPAVEKIRLLASGFALRFTQPVDPGTLKGITARRHGYKYHSAYGSPKVDEIKLSIGNSALSQDGKTLTLAIDDLKEGHVHTLDLKDLRTTGGKALAGDIIYYQLNRLPAR